MCTQMEDVKPTKDNSFEANTYDGEKKRNKEHVRVFVWEPCSLCEHLHMLQKQLTFRSCPFELEQTLLRLAHKKNLSWRLVP